MLSIGGKSQDEWSIAKKTKKATKAMSYNAALGMADEGGEYVMMGVCQG